MSLARDLANLGDGITGADLPAGSVLQVVSATKTDTFTTTSGTPVDITGYSATITPSSATSKILITSSFHISSGSVGSYPRMILLRGSSVLIQGDASGSASRVTAGQLYPSATLANNIDSLSYTYLDSPNTTSAITYKWQMSTFSGRTGTFNASEATSDSNHFNATSTITLMEIAG